MLTTTEAIVVKSMKYRDTSKIVTFYTRQFGKLKGIAKGARRANNKFGASLEPMSLVSLVIYRKEHQDLHLISQCDLIQSHKKIHDEMERMSVGLSVLELVDKLTHGEEENPALFSLLTDTLATLGQAHGNFISLSRAFQLRFAALFGFAPSLDECAECHKNLAGDERSLTFGFQLTSGSMVCANCVKTGARRNQLGSIDISAPTLQILRRFLSLPVDKITTITYNDRIGNELDETLRLYFRYHFDHMRDLVSASMFRSIVH